MTGGIVALIIWPLSILMGLGGVTNYNSKVNTIELRHRELIAAAAKGEVPITEDSPEFIAKVVFAAVLGVVIAIAAVSIYF